MRAIVEFLIRFWPLNRLAFLFWRYLPWPRGARSRFVRGVNDQFLVGVMALIVDGDGKMLLVRNTYDPRRRWSLPGGWMGRNEQPEDCICREMQEETGMEIDVLRLVVARTQPKLPSVDLLYEARIVRGIFQPSAEVSEIGYFSLEELPEHLAYGQRSLIRSIAAHVGADASPPGE